MSTKTSGTVPSTEPESKAKAEEAPKQLNPGGYPCNDCGITFRTPEELEEHSSKNSGKKAAEHIQ